MTTNLEKIFLNRLCSGLKRSAITNPSQWAEAYRVMSGKVPGPWSFKYYPWLRGMHDSKAERNVGKKAAQMGFTETVLNLVFYHVDIQSLDCLYILPAKTPDASDFSSARFDPAVELSPHLAHLFQDVKNVGHKRAGDANVYIRGSQSRSGLKSIPVSVLVIDELEEMDQSNIALAEERTSGQFTKIIWKISTPTVEDMGIDREYKLTTMETFPFKCPHCGKFVELNWPDSVVIVGESESDPRLKESHLICTECKHPLSHERKFEYLQSGIWVPQHKDRDIRGFHIPQQYSSTVHPADIAKKWFLGLSNPHDEQEFWNSKQGSCHIVEGARVTDTMILEAINKGRGRKKNDPTPGGLITLGCDVGPKRNHVEICQWFVKDNVLIDQNVQAFCRVLYEGTVQTFEEMDVLMTRFGVIFAVLDAQPEKRMAINFCRRWYGRAKACFYTRGITNRMIQVPKEAEQGEPVISVDRTSWLDLSIARFKNGTIALPIDTSLEYREQVKSLIRRYGKDKDGNPTGEYVKNENDQDHFAHARNYAEIALVFALSLGTNQNIGQVL